MQINPLSNGKNFLLHKESFINSYKIIDQLFNEFLMLKLKGFF